MVYLNKFRLTSTISRYLHASDKILYNKVLIYSRKKSFWMIWNIRRDDSVNFADNSICLWQLTFILYIGVCLFKRSSPHEPKWTRQKYVHIQFSRRCLLMPMHNFNRKLPKSQKAVLNPNTIHMGIGNDDTMKFRW